MPSQFELSYTERLKLWIIAENGKLVAAIFMDYLDQVEEVVLYADATAETQLQCLRLAASHAAQYVRRRDRDVFFEKLRQFNETLTEASSIAVMRSDIIPTEVATADRETILKEFERLRITVITAVCRSTSGAMQRVFSQVGAKRLRYEFVSYDFSRKLFLRFKVAKPSRFTFWKNAYKQATSMDLDIVPGYHPVMKDWEEVGLINGSTDTLISGQAVQTIYCPKAAQTIRRRLISSWDHLHHPFRAQGHTCTMGINANRIRSTEGIEELVTILRAALSLDKKYIAVSGGFQASPPHPNNRLNAVGRPSPYPQADRHNSVRGSENHCVWTHRILEAEGALASSYVPPWFYKEEWLDIYKGVPLMPGSY